MTDEQIAVLQSDRRRLQTAMAAVLEFDELFEAPGDQITKHRKELNECHQALIWLIRETLQDSLRTTPEIA